MKKTLCLLLCALCAWSAHAQAHGTVLRVAGFTASSRACQAFAGEHSQVALEAELSPYQYTSQLLNALVSGSFPYDVFTASSASFDLAMLMDKGYCADLSGVEAVRETVQRMGEPFASLVTRDGCIYGIPYSCHISYLSYCPETWEALGWSAADAPDSFPAFLSALEAWIPMAPDHPECVVFNSFAQELYGPSSYTDMLTGLLVDSQILQCSRAGEPLRFDTPAFLDCLTRCAEIGRQLYALEPVPNQGMPLFAKASGMESLSCLVPLRLTEEQPVLISASVSVAMVFAGSQERALAAELALAAFTAEETGTASAYLLSDSPPVEDPGYPEALAFFQARAGAQRERLAQADLSPAEYRDEELLLEEYQANLDRLAAGQGRYLISPQDLEAYRRCLPALYLQPPHPFLSTSQGEVNMRSLREQFASGLLPPEQFVAQADRLAAMLTLEDR